MNTRLLKRKLRFHMQNIIMAVVVIAVIILLANALAYLVA